VLAGLLILRVARTGTIGADAAIGVITTASFAIGLAIQARSGSVDRSLDAVLFGDVLGVAGADVGAIALVAVVVAVFVVGWRRELTFSTFDAAVARVSGVKVAWIDACLILAISITVVVSVRVIGALLVSAMLVLPAATARLLTESIARMLWLAPVTGCACGVAGMYVSWYADIPSGAAITLIGAALFGVAYAVSDAARRRALARMDTHGVIA
jgi:manganese/iron transport system permease protein/iron/zinc/copper transport system permease protein